MGTLRCPTCLSVLLDGGQSRCPYCRARLKNRKPVVLREEARMASRPVLAVERDRKAKVDAEIAAAERQRYTPATVARLETPHAPRLFETDAERKPNRLKRRERRPDTKPRRPADQPQTLLDVLADYGVEGAPERSLEDLVAEEMIAAVVVDSVVDVPTEAVDEVETAPQVDDVVTAAAATALAEPTVEKKVTGKTRSRLLRRRPMTPEQRMDDALASVRIEVKVEALKRALEEPVEPSDELADAVVEDAIEPLHAAVVEVAPEPTAEEVEDVEEAADVEDYAVEVAEDAEVAEPVAAEPEVVAEPGPAHVEVVPELVVAEALVADVDLVDEVDIEPVEDIWPQYDAEPPAAETRRGWRMPWIARRAPEPVVEEAPAAEEPELVVEAEPEVEVVVEAEPEFVGPEVVVEAEPEVAGPEVVVEPEPVEVAVVEVAPEPVVEEAPAAEDAEPEAAEPEAAEPEVVVEAEPEVEVAPEPVEEAPVALAVDAEVAPVEVWAQPDVEPTRRGRRSRLLPWIARRDPQATVAGEFVEPLSAAPAAEVATVEEPVVDDAPIFEAPIDEAAAQVEVEEDVAPVAADEAVAPATEDGRDEIAARVESSVDALVALMPEVFGKESVADLEVDAVADEHAQVIDASPPAEPRVSADEPIARVDAAVQALMALLPGTIEVPAPEHSIPVEGDIVDEAPVVAGEPETDAVEEPIARVDASVDALMALLETQTTAPPVEDALTEVAEPEVAVAEVAVAEVAVAEVAEPEVAVAEVAVAEVAEPEVAVAEVASVELAHDVAEVAPSKKRWRRSRLISRPAPTVEPVAEPVAEGETVAEPGPLPEVIEPLVVAAAAAVEDAAVLADAIVEDTVAEPIAAPKSRRRRRSAQRAAERDEVRTTLFDVAPLTDGEVVEAVAEPAIEEPGVVAQALDLGWESADVEPDGTATAKRRKRRIPKRSSRDNGEAEPATLFESAWAPEPVAMESLADLVAQRAAEPTPVAPIMRIVEPQVDEPEPVELGVVEAEVVAPEVFEPEIVEPEVFEPEVVAVEVVEPEVVEPEVLEPEIDLTVEPAAERHGKGRGVRGRRARRGSRPEKPEVVAREVVVPEIVEEPAAYAEAASAVDTANDGMRDPHDRNDYGNGAGTRLVAGDRRGDVRAEVVDRRKPVHPSVQLPAQTRAVRIKTVKENGRRRWVVDVLVRQDEANNKRK